MSSYSYFADFYDSLTDNVEYDKKADYITEIMKRHHHEFGLTLDLACGTGSLAVELYKRGVDIFGADASADMLTAAQQKTAEQGFQIMFLHQKMQHLHLFGTIDTCLCTLDSINHLPSKNDVCKTFESVYRYLNDGGLFVFDANTVYKHQYVLGDNCYIYDKKDVFCAWQNNFNARNNKVIITLDFFVPRGTIYERYSEQFSERAYTREEMTEMLTSSGLCIEAVYDDMSFESPKADSQREIYVTRKN